MQAVVEVRSGERRLLETCAMDHPAPQAAQTPRVRRREGSTRGPVIPASGPTRRVPLAALAYARSGDKGNTANIGVAARSPEAFAWLRGALTEERVRQYFGEFVRGRVTRYELPNLLAFNFVLEDALGGGGTLSLRADHQGKTLGQGLLRMELEVPAPLCP